MGQAARVNQTRIGMLAFAFIVSGAGCDEELSTLGGTFGELDPRRCKPAPGTTGTPKNVAEAMALLNGLPSPVTAECFVEALDRPLLVEASKSRASAQPAAGARSPRLFFFSGDSLIITAAFDGKGRDLIEFGESVSPRRSVKGELEFPLELPVPASAPFDRVRNEEHDNITTCFVCHDAERDEPGYPGGRSSLTLRPRKSSLVSVETLSTEFEACDWDAEPDRCAMLKAVVLWGPLEHREFDQGLPPF